jgi:hypothetical protein
MRENTASSIASGSFLEINFNETSYMRPSFLVGFCNALYKCNLFSALQKAQIFRRF